jgi:hypothetical protein
MNKWSFFTLSAITAVGLALLPISILAQQGTLRQQLVGTSMLVSCEDPANATRQPFCANPSGSFSLDANGRYTLVVAGRGRPKVASGSGATRAAVKPEEYKAVAEGVVAQFGTWSVNEGDKTLTRKTEGALFPNGEGAETKFSVSLSGDEVRFGAADTPAGAGTIWRRAKLVRLYLGEWGTTLDPKRGLTVPASAPPFERGMAAVGPRLSATMRRQHALVLASCMLSSTMPAPLRVRLLHNPQRPMCLK